MNSLEQLRDGMMHYIYADGFSGSDLTRDEFDAMLASETLREYHAEKLYLVYWGGGYVPRTFAVIARNEPDAYQACEDFLRDNHPDELDEDEETGEYEAEVSMHNLTVSEIREYTGHTPKPLAQLWDTPEAREHGIVARFAVDGQKYREVRVYVEHGCDALSERPVKVYMTWFCHNGHIETSPGQFGTLEQASAWLRSYASPEISNWTIKF
jgi:hypothetical protein